MKILQVYKDFYPPVKGGIENHINILSKGLMDRGVDVQVLVANTNCKFEIEKINNITIAKAPQWGRFYSAPLTPRFSFFLRKYGEDADIIHFHHPNPTAELAYFFSGLKKKVIVTYHSDIIRQDKLGKLYSPFRSIFLKKADKIIATSPNYIDSSDVLRKFKDKCTVISLGIDITRFRSNGDLPVVSKIRKENNDIPIVLFVGCFRYYKGLHQLLLAMKTVHGKLYLIGAGPEESRLRNIVAENQLSEKVIFLGQLEDEEVNAYYKACDIFVLPSHLRSEAFGLVLLEAMCCHKPVISTEMGTGTSYVNLNEQTGLTVKPNDIESLSTAVNYLIQNPDQSKRFGESGYRRVSQFFTSEKMVEETIKLYEKVTENDQRTKNFHRWPK